MSTLRSTPLTVSPSMTRVPLTWLVAHRHVRLAEEDLLDAVADLRRARGAPRTGEAPGSARGSARARAGRRRRARQREPGRGAALDEVDEDERPQRDQDRQADGAADN